MTLFRVPNRSPLRCYFKSVRRALIVKACRLHRTPSLFNLAIVPLVKDGGSTRRPLRHLLRTKSLRLFSDAVKGNYGLAPILESVAL